MIRPIRLTSLAATLIATSGLALPLAAQDAVAEHERMADAAANHVHDLLAEVADALALMHGPIAREVDRLHPEMLPAPHNLEPRAAYPDLPEPPGHAHAVQLIHHQAVHGGGSLGVLHGPVEHPIGVRWLPHSMFAQHGEVYGQWGHARLLHGIHAHAARHRSDD